MPLTAALQIAAASLVVAGFACAVGALMAGAWLQPLATSVDGAALLRALRRTVSAALALAVLGTVLSLWAAAAVMTGGTLADATAQIGTVALQTAYGRAALAAAALLLAAAAVQAFAAGRRGPADGAVAVLLAAFAAVHAPSGHAGDHGAWSLDVAIAALHLVLIAVWFGGVALAAWLVVPNAHAAPPWPHYLQRLSQAATLALAGIAASGLFNAWARVGAVGPLLGSAYGRVLLFKLGCVAVAAALGGSNKLSGFPALRRSDGAKARVTTVLRIESLVLLAALVAGAALGTLEPPAAG